MAAQVGSDREREILQIEFNSGSVYQDLAVDPEVWEDLLSTEAIGSFDDREIKSYYRSVKIE